jgi:hypothetical protein
LATAKIAAGAVVATNFAFTRFHSGATWHNGSKSTEMAPRVETNRRNIWFDQDAASISQSLPFDRSITKRL